MRALLAEAAAALREGRMPDHAGDVADFLARQARLQEAQAQRGRDNARRRSEAMEVAIRRAIGAWPVHGVVPRLRDVLDAIAGQPGLYGLRAAPDERTVRKVLRKVQAERHRHASTDGEHGATMAAPEPQE